MVVNQILVTQKIYVTPELRRKKKIYKLNFFLSVFLVCSLFSYYIYAEYDRNKNEEVSKEILASIDLEYFEEEPVSSGVRMEDNVLIVTLNDDDQNRSEIDITKLAQSIQMQIENKKKEKVIAYAASLGSAALSQKYDKKFSGLLKYVDVISVREAAAVPYVKRLCRGDVAAVLDPVFLLEEKEWAAIENRPRINQYILVYTTEKNKKLYEYAKKLSQEKGMEVVELRTIRGKREKGFITDDTAGPAEFLGYVHKAAYVVTNSFHGIAFSIIYKKKFLAFPHGSFGTRIENILRIHGLENRIYEDERSIDDNIDWDEVNRRMQDAVRQSYDFLVKNIRD